MPDAYETSVRSLAAFLTRDGVDAVFITPVCPNCTRATCAIAHYLESEGILFFTGASGSLRGRANFAHFASMKAGLRMLAQSLARGYGPEGVHVAHFVIDGVVDGDRLRSRMGAYLDSLGEEGSLSPEAIAVAYWYVHTQPRNA